MNLYEFEGKKLFEKHGIAVPKGVVVRRGDDPRRAYEALGAKNVVVKAQVLSGKRGKGGGIRFCSSTEETESGIQELFNANIRGQYVAAVRIEEKLDISEEHYLSITYDTNAKVPVVIYSKAGGMNIEDVPTHQIEKIYLDVRSSIIPSETRKGGVEESFMRMFVGSRDLSTSLADARFAQDDSMRMIFKQLWRCFLAEDCRLVEINPLVKTKDRKWIAVDAKVALDDDAFFRHKEWSELEPRTMMGRPPTEREQAVKQIDEGENYYRGTAGKYIEMQGDIAILFSGGGASIANMDALIKAGLEPANYTEYSGNPPREKVYQLAKIVLSKPGLRGLWIAGGVANFTNVRETFHGIVDALDEVKPTNPIVVRRAGPFEKEGMKLMGECARRNNLNMKLFGKETSMSETAKILADMMV